MDAVALVIDLPSHQTVPIPRAKKRLYKNPVRVALLCSLLVHVVALAACSLLMISVRRAALHDTKSSDPLAVTIVTDLRENCDAPLPQMVLEPRPEISELDPMQPQRITEIETVEQVEPKTEENGFQDAEDGGTQTAVTQSRSGGGGGDDTPSPEVGHVRLAREDWSRTKVKTVAAANVIGAGGESGRGAPGVLNAPGSGRGLGNGAGSGALGSSGSGTGAGSGRDGQGSGSGMGTKAPVGITRNAEPIQIFGGSYPSDAKRQGHEGLVKVDVEVLTDGRVGTVKLAQSSGYDELDQSALAAAQSWTFRPALQNGEPIVMWRRVPYRYTLATVAR